MSLFPAIIQRKGHAFDRIEINLGDELQVTSILYLWHSCPCQSPRLINPMIQINKTVRTSFIYSLHC